MTREREALRQQMLLCALWRDAGSEAAPGWLPGVQAERGLAAYRRNAGALAERALGAAFPTVAQLVGAETFGLLARDVWRRHPPQRGDLAEFGAEFPQRLADDEQLASEPYLADVARLDWAVHRAASAADDASGTPGLERLADGDPAQLVPRPAGGAALVESRHPVASIWLAHRSEAGDRFEAARAALAAGRGEAAFVWRRGWRVEVARLPEHDVRFMRSLLSRRSLQAALEDAGAGFAFEPWLLHALREGWLAGVDTLPAAASAQGVQP